MSIEKNAICGLAEVNMEDRTYFFFVSKIIFDLEPVRFYANVLCVNLFFPFLKEIFDILRMLYNFINLYCLVNPKL